MLDRIGPPHYLFFGALYRKRLYLAHLLKVFEPFGDANWPASLSRLEREFSQALGKLSPRFGTGLSSLAIKEPFILARLLDDTPADSLLMRLSEDIDRYELLLLELMTQHAVRSLNAPNWLATLQQTAGLWGREVAQESLLAARATITSHLPQAFEAFSVILKGGDFSWKPLLPRRRTPHELEYELRNCPHRRSQPADHGDFGENINLACRLESMVFQGFIETIVPDVEYGRFFFPTYCLDRLTLQ